VPDYRRLDMKKWKCKKCGCSDIKQKALKRGICKSCNCLRAKEYRDKNPEHSKKYYKDNQESILKKSRERAQYESSILEKNLKKRAYYSSWKAKKKGYMPFSLTEAEYRELIQKHPSCPICGVLFGDGKSYCIDHDHSTGAVRGLLCNACNYMLGCANDNTSILSSGIAYLESFK